MGTSRPIHVGLRNVQSPCEVRGSSRDYSAVASGAEVLIWNCGRNLRFPLPSRHGSWQSSGVSTGESGLVSCGHMHVRSPLKLEKQRQACSQVDTGISGSLSRYHPPSCFELILGMTIESVAGESGVSGVHWDIEVFSNGGTTPGVPLECQMETASS